MSSRQKHYHREKAEINAGKGQPDLYVLSTWKTMLDLANLVLHEQALLEHDDLLIFDEELDKILIDYSRNKEEYKKRLNKMREATGIHAEIIGGHVFTIDDFEKNAELLR